MLHRIEGFIRKHGLLSPGASVVAGVSGGADSVALLYALWSLAPSMGLKVYAAHLNHSIRGAESDGDEEFVRGLCEFYGVPLYRGRADVPALARGSHQTLEQAGRTARYGFLEEARLHFGADVIAVAHHMDDQAETILLHMTRGTGLAGLSGMQPQRERVIRPLLFARRGEIVDYLAEEGIAFCTDSTNLLADGTRNRLRLDVIPYIERNINPAIVPALCSMGELLTEDEAYLCAHAAEALEAARRGGGYDRALLAALPAPLRTRALRMALAQAGVRENIERVHIAGLEGLLTGRTGAMLRLPGGAEVHAEYALLRILPPAADVPPPEFELPLALVGKTETPLGTFIAEECSAAELVRDPFTACFDMDKLPEGGLTVRTRRPGDRFHPLGALGSRKLKAFFIDKKTPRQARSVPLIAHGGDVLFVPGYCIADAVKIGDGSARMLRVTFQAKI